MGRPVLDVDEVNSAEDWTEVVEGVTVWISKGFAMNAANPCFEEGVTAEYI